MNQAALMAYIDIFFTWAVIAAALVPFALLLIRQMATRPAAHQSGTEAWRRAHHFRP